MFFKMMVMSKSQLNMPWVANDARKSYEKQTKKSAILKNNSLNYKYLDDKKLIED